jgi:thioredoxin-dependent peroxiredoxin
MAKKSKKKVQKKSQKKVQKKAVAKTKKTVKASPKKATKATKKSTTKKVAPKKAAKKVVAPNKKAVAKKVVKAATKKSIKKTNASVKKQSIKKVVKKIVVKKSVNKPKPIIKTEAPKFVKHKTRLKVGDFAPNFEGKEQDGNTISLHSLKGKKVILYFYPKDDTPGCTATACSLRDEQTFLRDKNYAVVGVSGDDEKSHAKFAAKYELPFPLLADTNFAVAKAYDVFGKKQFMGRITEGIVRTTFVINENGIITQVIDAVDTENHAQQVLGLENAI